jgi:DNA-directed RNA polymerase subunit RPC12/RpoP
MVSYLCSTCQKEFTNKSKYTRHLNRKNPCKRVEKKDPENTRKYPKIPENTRKYPRDPENTRMKN